MKADELRSTFWIGFSNPEKIQIKCNLNRVLGEYKLDNLKAALNQNSILEPPNDVKRMPSPPIVDKFFVERSLIKDQKSLKIMNSKFFEKVSKIEKVNKKVHGKFSKTGRSSQIYKFIDWEKAANDKGLSPVDTKLREEHLPYILPKPFNPSSKLNSKPDSKWIILTDINTDTNFQKANLIQIPKERKDFAPGGQSIAAGIFRISTTGQSNEKRETVNNFNSNLTDVRKRIGIINDLNDNKIRFQTPNFQPRNSDLVALNNLKTVIDIEPLRLDNKVLISDSEFLFDYTLTTPAYAELKEGGLKLNYAIQLAAIYEHHPVSSQTYSYRGKSIMHHDKTVTDMICKLEYTPAEKLRETNLIQRQYSVIVDEEKSRPDLLGIASRPRFKYILVKVGLDDRLTVQDFTNLTKKELHMLIAFFNAKFCIADKPGKLNIGDSSDHIVDVANFHIEGVLSRANKFKKNEEFLKKKWKQFLKFCRFKIKADSNYKSDLKLTKAPVLKSRQIG